MMNKAKNQPFRISYHYWEPFVQNGVLFNFTKGKRCILGLAASHSEIIKLSLPVYSPWVFHCKSASIIFTEERVTFFMLQGNELVSSFFLWSSTTILEIFLYFGQKSVWRKGSCILDTLLLLLFSALCASLQDFTMASDRKQTIIDGNSREGLEWLYKSGGGGSSPFLVLCEIEKIFFSVYTHIF